jgi:phage/plasmid-like protein (TIGR03299 family)
MLDAHTQEDDMGLVPVVSRNIARSLDLISRSIPQTSALARYQARSFADLLPETGHAFSASKRPVYTGDGMVIADTYAVQRDDTGDVLGVVGSRYEVTQPLDLARSLDGLFHGLPLSLESALTVRGGSELCLMARLPDELSLRLFGGKDVTHPRVLFRTSFDGRSPTIGVIMGKRLVCTNGLRVDSIVPGSAWKVRHTLRAEARRKVAVEALRGWATQWKGFSDAAGALAEKRIPARSLPGIVRSIVEPEILPPEKELSHPKQRAVRTILELVESGLGTYEVAEVRGTAWGVLNAVTEYANHYAPARGDAQTQAQRRLERVFDGDDLAGRAFQVLRAL